MIPVQFNIDIFEELHRLEFDEFLVPFPVIKELDKLITSGKGKDKIAAKVGRLLVVSRCNIISVYGRHVDDIIVNMAKEYTAAVLTNDIGLKKRLLDMSVVVISLRQKSKLGIVSK